MIDTANFSIEQLKKIGAENIDSLPAFLRTATTNLRYNEENRFSASQEIEDPRRMAKNLLHGKHTLLKSFSQDVSAMVQDILYENKRMKFLQGIKLVFHHFQNQHFFKGTDTELEFKLNSQNTVKTENSAKNTPDQKFVNVSDASKQGEGFGNLITKSKIKEILKKFQQMNEMICDLLQNENLDNKNLSEQNVYLNVFYNIDMLYFFNISRKMIVLMKFMLSTPQKMLFKLRKKLYFDEFSHEDQNFAYSADLSLENVLNRLSGFFTESIADEYMKVFRDSSLLIMEQFRISFAAIMKEFNDLKKAQNLIDDEGKNIKFQNIDVDQIRNDQDVSSRKYYFTQIRSK